MIKPITPDEAIAGKNRSLPQEVIEAFNLCIGTAWDGGSACFKAKEVALVIAKMKDVPTGVVLKNHWLDVEAIYREAGWKVVYDQPGFNEAYDATFTFSKK